MSIRISIIIPVYNVEQYIIECLQSVVDQTAADLIECIVVDDKGTDQSFALAKEFVEASQRVGCPVSFQLVEREKNGGLSAARNSGVSVATGEYLYFLDSDDYLIPTAIETLLALADKHGCVDLLPALYITDDGHPMNQFGVHSFPEFSDDRKLIKRALLNYDRIPVTSANRLIRREWFLQHQLWLKEGIIHEDNYWTFFAAKHAERMAFCPKKIYYYRTNEGSITRRVNVQKESHAFKTLITDFSDNIDSFEAGAQKRLIFLNVLTMWRSGYYTSLDEAKLLIRHFAKTNSAVERLLLRVCLYFDAGTWFNNKCINLLQRLYLR